MIRERGILTGKGVAEGGVILQKGFTRGQELQDKRERIIKPRERAIRHQEGESSGGRGQNDEGNDCALKRILQHVSPKEKKEHIKEPSQNYKKK